MSKIQAKPIHLPKQTSQNSGTRYSKLQQKLQALTNSTNPDVNKSEFQPPDSKVQKNIQVLKLRIKLIGDCTQLSVERIQHLQQIFKHYCTHIFKIGKHMTFQRLQYEKVHLTLDRLCVFLKDFGLTTAKIGEIQYEIIDKQEIVRNFKRLSKNCRDLGFQEFIACLQKLSSVYYDQKQFYLQKTEKAKQQRQARIQQYKKKMKEKKRQEAKRKALQSSINNDQNENEEQNKQEEKNENQQGEQNQQNDDLVKNMMQDEKIENPNDEINKAVKGEGQNQFQAESKIKQSKLIKKQTPKIIQEQYVLTVEQKIEYFYQLLGVDNVHDFRKKMSELGLPLFKLYQPPGKHAVAHKRSTSTKLSNQLLNVTVENSQQEDERRLIELRQKLNIKRERDKHMYSPVISKEQYQQRKKRREEKQAQIMKQMNVSKVTANDHALTKQKEKKKIELMDKQLSLDMLNHISFDELKLKFDPKKYVASDESDQVYLNQYGVQIQSGPPNSRKRQAKSSISKPDIRQKTATTLQRKRTSSNIVQDFKKRAYEMQVKQFHKQAQLSKFVNDMKKKQKFRNQKM